MITKLYPKHYEKSIFDISYDALWESGVRGLLFDIDNTLVSYDVVHPTPEIVKLFDTLKQRGFQICLVSNNTQDRVLRFNEQLKIFALHKAKKPRRVNLRRAMSMMGLQERQIAMIGDQVFTDVLAGNRAGVTTVLVVPVSEKDEWITKIKRGIEKKVIKRYEKSRQKGSSY